MRPETVIGERDTLGWKPTTAHQDAWRAAGALQPLNPALVFADRMGSATPLFLGVWRGAFANARPPMGQIVTASGLATEAYRKSLDAVT